MRRKETSGEGWGPGQWLAHFVVGKGVWIKHGKARGNCVLCEVLQVPYIQSLRVLQVTLYKTQKSQGEWVGKRLIKEWEVGGCERNFNVCVCVRQEPFHLPAPGPLMLFFWNCRLGTWVGGVHCYALSQMVFQPGKHRLDWGLEEEQRPSLFGN